MNTMYVLTERTRAFVGTLRRALHFVWLSSPGLTISGTLVRVIQGLLPLAVLYLTKLLIDAVTRELSGGAQEKSLASIAFFLGGLAGAAALNALLTVVASYISRVHLQVVTDHMHALLQAKSIEVDLEYYENANYQDTLHRAQQEAPYRPTAILNSLLQLVQDGISLLAMAAVLWWLHWSVIPVLIVSSAPYFFVRLKQSSSLFAWERDRTSLERKAWYFNSLLTMGVSAKEVRLFGLGPRVRRWFQDVRRILRTERIALERRWALANLAAHMIGVIGVFGLYSFVALRTVQGTLTVGDLVMYFQAVQRASTFLEGLGWGLSGLYESNLFLSALDDFMAVKSRLPLASNPVRFPAPIRTGLVFEKVSFQYPEDDRLVLRDFTLSIAPGEHVALVGANGAGKTTLVKLLCRLYDPTAGRITIDGVDIRDYAIDSVRGAVSGIFQDFGRFQLSAKDNIELSVTAGNSDLAAVMSAARQAGIHDVIERLPQGYDSQLGRNFDGGHELSIGEWQKVALARAVLRESQILILDEPTSAMDAKAEAELFERFHELARGRMALLISHRLSTVKMADRIYVIDNGGIVEQGTHDELIQLQGLYATLFLTQARYYQ
ncbi:Lipid A export ATP-binding/permease protein MsbA [Nitrospira sp. KM1]|uniref:ABC transporter ATP-binding protein n=1 Tax=Nitrospira sp. KM1 TaxID=1936990 RepID=UPI0013A72406|nr:ABC transporter ATP-binding protein [Nitrospira sp. KM1]BCA56836.1 Lipid A export ATP-binding/permease protein MsbA [Nitrospira sp. KM1]